MLTDDESEDSTKRRNFGEEVPNKMGFVTVRSRPISGIPFNKDIN